MADADDPPESLLEALGVRRRVRRGFAVGTLIAVVLFAVFVVGAPTDRPAALYAVLGAVLAFTTGLLVTGLLVVAAAVRLLRG